MLRKRGQRLAIYFPPILEVITKHLVENWLCCSLARNPQIRTTAKRPEGDQVSPLTVHPKSVGWHRAELSVKGKELPQPQNFQLKQAQSHWGLKVLLSLHSPSPGLSLQLGQITGCSLNQQHLCPCEKELWDHRKAEPWLTTQLSHELWDSSWPSLAPMYGEGRTNGRLDFSSSTFSLSTQGGYQWPQPQCLQWRGPHYVCWQLWGGPVHPASVNKQNQSGGRWDTAATAEHPRILSMAMASSSKEKSVESTEVQVKQQQRASKQTDQQHPTTAC